MSADAPQPGALTDQLKQEQSFRKQIMSGIIQLLSRPDTDPLLKMLVVLGCFVILGISFTFSVCILHVIHAAYVKATFDPFKYAELMAGEVVVLGGVSVPAVVRASAHEQALRLEESFNKVRDARARH